MILLCYYCGNSPHNNSWLFTRLSSYYEKFADGKVVCIDEEIPFDLPNTWKWCRLSSIILGTGAGKSPNCDKRPKKDNEWGVLTTTAIQYCDFLPNENKVLPTNYIVNQEQEVKYEDLLITRAGPRNRTGIVCVVNKTCSNLILSDKTVRIEYVREYCNPYYLMYALNSPTIHDNVMAATVGMAASQVNISQNSIQNIAIPLPPYKEQEKIVNRLNTVLPYLKKYSTVKEQQDKLNENIGPLLKKSILQEAIQGRLVPQNASEEPATLLLQRIKEEKLRLVAEGKLKKKDVTDSTIFRGDDNKYYEQIGKKISDISEEIQFEIPPSWEWCRISALISLLSGRDLNPTQYNSSHKGIPYITGASNIENETLLINRWTETPVTISHKGDLLLTCKGTIGKLAYNSIGEIHIARQIMAISSIYIYMPYLRLFICSQISEFQKKAQSMIPGIAREAVLNAIIPVPPFHEQIRIANKVEELYVYL